MADYRKVGRVQRRYRPATTIRPPTSGSQGSRTDLVVTTASSSTAGTSWDVDLPTYLAGDRVVVCVSAYDTGAADITGVTGFSEVKTASSDANRGAVYEKIMNGTEGSTATVTFAAGPQSCVAIAFSHHGLDWSTYTTDSASGFVTGTQNPPQVTFSHGSTLTYDVYVFWGGVHAAGAVEVTTPSSGYTELVDQQTGPGDTSAGLMHKSVTGSASEDPGAYTINTGGTDCLTFAIVSTGSADLASGGHGHPVKKNGTTIGTRSGINLIEGTNVTLTVTDDSANDEVDVTIAASGGSGSAPDWIADLAAPDTVHGDDQEFTGTIGGTAVTPTGTATWTQDEGLLSVAASGQSASDQCPRLYALTPSASPVTLTTRFRLLARKASNPMAGLCFTDGTTATSNAVSVGIYTTTTTPIVARWAGTLTNMSTTNIFTDLPPGILDSWIYMRLVWTASNTWAWALSPDGVSWTDFGASTFAATLTPTHFGPWVSSWSVTYPIVAAFEYVRVAESDLSV